MIRKTQRARYTFRNRQPATLYAKNISKKDRLFVWFLTRFEMDATMDQHLVANSPLLAEACAAAKFSINRANWLTTQPAWGRMLEKRARKRALMQGIVLPDKFLTTARWDGAWKTRMKKRLRTLAKPENQGLRPMVLNGESRQNVILNLQRQKSCAKRQRRRDSPRPMRSYSWCQRDYSHHYGNQGDDYGYTGNSPKSLRSWCVQDDSGQDDYPYGF